MLREPTIDSGAGGDSDAGPPVTEVLRAALAPLKARISVAFIYGPMAKGTAHGDIDLMIIGSGIAYADVLALLIKAAKHIGCSIQPSVYEADEWKRKLAAGNRVALAVMKQRKIFLFGSEESLPQPR